MVTPSEAVGVVPELTPDLGQLDALPWLLESATIACESYVGRSLMPTTYDQIDYDVLNYCDGLLRLDSWPVTSLRLQTNPQVGLTITGPTGAVRATVAIGITSASDSSISTLTLKKTGSADVPLALPSYATIADLAAAVTIAGWTASTSYGTHPTSDLVAVSGPCTVGAKDGADLFLYANDMEGYRLTNKNNVILSWDWGSVRVGSGWAGRSVRKIYTAGYAVVPSDLKSACIMMALHLRESAKTAGPVSQQGMRDRYYTLAPTLDLPAPCKVILDRYVDMWGVA